MSQSSSREARRSGVWASPQLVARLLIGALGLAVGLFYRLALRLPLDPLFYAVIVAWLAIALAYFQLARSRPSWHGAFVPRLALFLIEVAVAIAVAWLLGAGPWLVVLLILPPLLEWSFEFAAVRGIAGAAVAVVAAAIVVAAQVSGAASLPGWLASVGPERATTVVVLGVFLVTAAGLAGISFYASRFAEAGRRKSRRLEELNRELRQVTDDLRQSRDTVEAAYGELHGAQAELVNSARLATLGMLVAGIAHELNTPMGALNSNHDVLRRSLKRLDDILADERVDEDELDDVRRIVRAVNGVMKVNDMAVERMVHLVKSLRTFGRPDRSEIDRVDLREGIESAVALLGHELRDRITVVRELQELPSVECYPHQLNQVFMNLILNAAQAIQGPGTITLRTRAGDGEVFIEVQDTGSGIPPEHLERIFEPGFSTKGARMGMGLGLLITRQIVERHGGRLAVQSEVGEGTTFTLSLPVRLRAEPTTAVDASGENQPVRRSQ